MPQLCKNIEGDPAKPGLCGHDLLGVALPVILYRSDYR